MRHKEDASYAVTRPINTNIMLQASSFDNSIQSFNYAIAHIHEIENDQQLRGTLNKFIYTCQQSIGAALDALPAGNSNRARKINGDLFERLIRLVLSDLGIAVSSGTVKLQVPDTAGGALCTMHYQHDIVLKKDAALKAIGSVKTSSKDRIDKIFIDKFLYNKLTDLDIPHFAIFLNDVQRKGRAPRYGINSTFLPGRFKGYTIKLTPLNGVYYCDLRPVMTEDRMLHDHIKTLDPFLVTDVWSMLATD